MNDLISREYLLSLASAEGAYEYVSAEEIAKAPTVPAIPIPTGATNGDMIKALFPCLEKYEYEEPYTHGIALAGNDNRVTWFANEWWNAPYKAEGEN